MFATDDTIVAIATPPGRGGLGVVRLSGPDAPGIVLTLLGRGAPLEPRRATFARLRAQAEDGGPHVIDQVVVTSFTAPHSYTGEAVVEISAHGSPVLLQRIVGLAMDAGARLAQPGEFTLRAYLNGRIDLVQAEAVADLIDAVTPLQARAAMDQLEGTLTTALRRIDAALFDVVARLEASLDFPDEGFHFVTPERAGRDLAGVARDLDALAREGGRGRLVREGAVVAIGGPPNAGKSSLFNALVGAPRAIVTDVPGTTRDMVTERVDLSGLPITLMDTAGLREQAADVVEAEGVFRAREAQHVAGLRLLVFDGTSAFGSFDRQLIERTAAPAIVVVNKIDCPRRWDPGTPAGLPIVEISALTGAGLDALRAAIVRVLGAEPEERRDVPAISNLRHLALVREARGAVDRANEALAVGATEEIVLTELAAARAALESVTGRREADDVLRHIFARFCVGK
jgi:tRNA modification GTPase